MYIGNFGRLLDILISVDDLVTLERTNPEIDLWPYSFRAPIRRLTFLHCSFAAH